MKGKVMRLERKGKEIDVGAYTTNFGNLYPIMEDSNSRGCETSGSSFFFHTSIGTLKGVKNMIKA